MRLKKDKNSWHASGLIARDSRHDKSSPEVSKPKSKKDCKTWCRGKVGRHHQGEWKPWAEVRNHGYSDTSRFRDHSRVLVCKNCDRHLDTCWSWFGGRCKAPNHGHHVPKK